MGSKSDQTTTQESTPWEGQQPYLQDIFRQAQGLYQGGPQQYFPGQTVAPFSPQTQMGMDALMQQGMGGQQQMQGMQNWANQAFGNTMDPRSFMGGGYDAMQGIQPGMNMMQQAGNAGLDLGGASQYAGGAINPYAQALQGSMGYGGLGEASQFFGSQGQGALPASDQYAQQAMGAGGQGLAALGQTAGGGFLGSNPYLDQVYDVAAGKVGDTFQEQIMPGINATFGAGGRTGSGIQALTTGKAAEGAAEQLRGLAGDIYAPAYESERDRMTQAAQGLGGFGQGGGQLGIGGFGAQTGRLGQAANLYTGERGLGQQAMGMGGNLGLGGAQLGADMWGQGLNRQLQAGQGMGNLGMQGFEGLSGLQQQLGQQAFGAATQMPSLQQMGITNAEQLMRVGGMNEDQAQRLIQADMNRWNFGQQSPWQNLGQYSSAIYGLPGNYGTQTQTTPGGSRLAGMMGGAMGAGGMSSWNPWAMAGGAVLGGLG